MAEYTQGICQDGAAILKDGQTMTIEEILKDLNSQGNLVGQLRDLLELMEDSERRYNQGQEAPNMRDEIMYTRELLAEIQNTGKEVD